MSGAKSVIVVADHLPAGLAANAAAVLAVTLGSRLPHLVGSDAVDADGIAHAGLVQTPLPVLRHTSAGIRELVGEAARDDEVVAATFSSLAQSCRTYDEYLTRMLATRTDGLELVGIALHGPRKRVDRLAGALPLLR